jgi:hypothetical protein
MSTTLPTIDSQDLMSIHGGGEPYRLSPVEQTAKAALIGAPIGMVVGAFAGGAACSLAPGVGTALCATTGAAVGGNVGAAVGGVIGGWRAAHAQR